jgi:hypothetical protein
MSEDICTVIARLRLRKLALVLVLMATCGHARSESVPLACAGKMTAADRNVTEDYTIAIRVDLLAKTVTIGSYGTVPIVGDTDEDIVAFAAVRLGWLDKDSPDRVFGGSINRVTGVVSVNIITITDGEQAKRGGRRQRNEGAAEERDWDGEAQRLGGTGAVVRPHWRDREITAGGNESLRAAAMRPGNEVSDRPQRDHAGRKE